MSFHVPSTVPNLAREPLLSNLFKEEAGRPNIAYQSLIAHFAEGDDLVPHIKTVLLAHANWNYIIHDTVLKVAVLVALQKEKIQDEQSIQLRKKFSKPHLEEAAFYFLYKRKDFEGVSGNQEWHRAFTTIVERNYRDHGDLITYIMNTGDVRLADLLFRDNDVRMDGRFLGGDNILAYALKKKQYKIALSILRRDDAHTLIFPKLGAKPFHLIRALDTSKADENEIIHKVRRAAWKRAAFSSGMRRRKGLAKAHAQYKNISTADLEVLRKKGWNQASTVKLDDGTVLTEQQKNCVDAAHRFTREAHKQGTLFVAHGMKGNVAILTDLLSRMGRRKKVQLRIENGAKVFPNAAAFLDVMVNDQFQDNDFSHSFLSTSRLFNTNTMSSALYFLAKNSNVSETVDEMGQEMICRFVENENLRSFFVEEYSKIQQEFQFSRLNIHTIPETTLLNEKTNYVYAAAPWGRKCAAPLQGSETRQENFARVLGAYCESPCYSQSEAPDRQYRILVGNFEQDPEGETFPFDTLNTEQQANYDARMDKLTQYMHIARGLEKLSKTTSAKEALSLLKAFFELEFSSAHQGIRQGLIDIIKQKSDILGQIIKSSQDANGALQEGNSREELQQLTGKQWEEYLQMLSPENETEKKRGSYAEIGLAITVTLGVASFVLSLIHQITLGSNLRNVLRYGGFSLPIIAMIVYHIYSKKSTQFISESRVASPPLPKLKKIPDSYFHLTRSIPEDFFKDANGCLVRHPKQNFLEILAQAFSDPKAAREGSMNQGWLTSSGAALRNDKDDTELAETLIQDRRSYKESRTEQYKLIKRAFPQIELPPPLRPVWSDCQDSEGNTPEPGKVVGYHPLLLFNFKFMRSILVNTITRVRKELIDSGKLNEEDLDNCYENALKLLFRFTTIKMLEESSYNPYEKGKLRSENPIAPFFPIDHDTFDMQESHGRDARNAINEPYLTKTMMDALIKDKEYGAFIERAYDTSDKPEKNQRVSLLIDLVDEISDAIQKKYVAAGQGREALPKRLDSKPIRDAIAGPILG